MFLFSSTAPPPKSLRTDRGRYANYARQVAATVSPNLRTACIFTPMRTDIKKEYTHTLQKNDGYFNPYVRLSQLHLSIPGTIECAECVGDLLSNEAIEQLRKRELQVD